MFFFKKAVYPLPRYWLLVGLDVGSLVGGITLVSKIDDAE
jgi:hypothetical protein